MDLTGAQITAILNEQWNGSTNEGPATGSTQNANNKMLQVSGLNYTWDFSDASLVGELRPWSVVTVDHDGNDAHADGAAIDPNQTYRVVANNFLADGGDSFVTFKQGTNRLIGGLDIDSLRLYLLANDPYTVPTTLDRITRQE